MSPDPPPRTPTSTPASPPLAGVRILDLSALLPGPYATRLLADLGAEVVKLERPTGDDIRHMLPGTYEFLNRGKRVVAVDLKSRIGLDRAHDLLTWADVVVEGFRPGVARRLDVGFETARRLRPDTVYCSISGFGQDGPQRNEPGHDLVYEAAGGAFAGLVAAGAEIARPHLPIGDLGSALFAALTICATLADQDREGAVHLDLSMQESVAYLAVSRWGSYLLDGRPPEVEQLGNFSPGHRVYRTSDDRHLALAAVEDRFWSALCVALERPDLNEAPFDTHAGRMVHRLDLERRLGDEIGQHELDPLVARLRGHDVPATIVAGPQEVAASPHLRVRGAIAPDGSGHSMRYPVRWNGSRL